MPSENRILVLTPPSFLKHLEERYLFNIETDELYEVNLDAYQFLLQLCRGTTLLCQREIENSFFFASMRV